MAQRRIGRLTIRVKYKDRRGAYEGQISVPLGEPGPGAKFAYHDFLVGPPATLTHAVDSKEAFDSTVQAAVNFAIEEGGKLGERIKELAVPYLQEDGTYQMTRR